MYVVYDLYLYIYGYVVVYRNDKIIYEIIVKFVIISMRYL